MIIPAAPKDYSAHGERRGLRQRLICASQRVLDYLDGKVDRIEELEEPRLTFNGLPESGCPYILYHPWKNMVRSGV